MNDMTDWKDGFAKGFREGFLAASSPSFETEEILLASDALASQFGVEAGKLVRVYRNEDGDLIGAILA